MPDNPILDPDQTEPRRLRDALGRFATGVTVVTTQTTDGPLAIVANSFASVSLDPPLVLWSPARASRRFAAFAEATHYAIHVLAAEQTALIARFARGGTDFDLPGLTFSPRDVPLLPDCLSHFECISEARHAGGDHLILVGRVLDFSFRPGAPLVFSSGAYGTFLPRD